MRAVEGGWSRRDVRALPGAPELMEVSVAVNAAQAAVEQVLTRNGMADGHVGLRTQSGFGRPLGLPRARYGRGDDLKQISGLGPLDESTLNNLGIYHFDQVAGWDEREVLWLENHAFARGRIGREQWQSQARALAAGRAGQRA
jgi:NADH-quinone oxidoreductase subunit E